MKSRIGVAALAAVLLVLPSWDGAAAQAPDTAFVYSSYWECGGGLGDAVATLRDDWGAILQGHMDAGHITAWGVLTHNTGNKWSLANYTVGPEVGPLMQALDDAQAEYFQAHPEKGRQFGESCPTHEDYIWMAALGSQAPAEMGGARPAAGMSVYWVCDEGKEAVADLIVEQVWAPVLNRQVEQGSLSSWVWLSHFVGGEYRRALVVDGADHATLLEARDEMIARTSESALASAFSEVCNGHTDVLWNIADSRP